MMNDNLTGSLPKARTYKENTFPFSLESAALKPLKLLHSLNAQSAIDECMFFQAATRTHLSKKHECFYFVHK